MLLVKGLELLTGRKVSLELAVGRSYVLQGPNGSGKTVLLRTLAALYPTRFKSFQYQGKSIDDYVIENYRSKVLYVGSSTHWPGEMTAEEFLSAPFKLGIYRGLATSFPAKDYLEKWELSGKNLAHLSSGQKQLLVFLRTLSLKAELLLLDEPTSHMDKEKTREVEDLLLKWMTPQRCYLMVSHSDIQAERMGEKILFTSLSE